MPTTHDVRREVSRSFQLHGLTLRSDAANQMTEWLEPFETKSDRRPLIEQIIAQIQKLPLESGVIDLKTLESAAAECSQADSHVDNVFEVVGAFDVPQYEHCTQRKKFLERSEMNIPKPTLLPSADAKARLHRHRYNVIHQRVIRHELFAVSSDESQEANTKYRLRTVGELIGAPGRIPDVVVLGMLVTSTSGKYMLEDPTGTIELDIANAVFHMGLFMENCVVLIEGTLHSTRRLIANAVGMPPVEPSAMSRAYIGHDNYTFGGVLRSSAKNNQALQLKEQVEDDEQIVFLGEVHLDVPDVMRALTHLFDGFSHSPPCAFVLTGDFCSRPYGYEHRQLVEDGLRELTKLICKYPTIRQSSHFVFVPGLQDLAVGDILPRPPLPESMTKYMRETIRNVHFTTNPCRIRYCTQEMVILREDIIEKMSRNCLRMPSEAKDIVEHFCRTITSQAHLTPLPLHVSPIYWSYDHALRLYPLPDVVVVADKHDATHVLHEGCTVGVTSSFSGNNFAFQVYFPATREFEESAITLSNE